MKPCFPNVMNSLSLILKIFVYEYICEPGIIM